MTGRAATRPSDDRRLVTGTWRRVAVQTAVLIALGIIALDALAVGVVLDIEHRDNGRLLAQALADPDAVDYPPLDTIVYQVGPTGLRTSPAAPAEPVDPAGLADPPAHDRVVHRGGREFLVRTQRNGDTTTQVALDLTRQDDERDRLFAGLAAAGGAGIFLAGGLGALVARRSIAPLGQAIARQRRFVADASHELRTPLTQLHLRAQLLDRSLADSPPQIRDDLAHLVRASRQMGEILDELLTAAQLDAQPRRREPVDLWALAGEVVAADQVRAVDQGVALTVRRAEPDAVAEDLVVPGAPTALRRVLSSLVDNALAHTPAGGHVTVELARSGALVRIDVCDTGSGFDPAQTPGIFDRFRRGGHDDPRRFGLGLALAQEVVAAHDGTIEATSAPGAGACFTVTLPA